MDFAGGDGWVMSQDYAMDVLVCSGIVGIDRYGASSDRPGIVDALRLAV